MELDIDNKSKQIALSLSLTATQGTALAKNIADVGKMKSLFANLRTSDCAVHGSATMGLPKSLQKVFTDAMDDAQTKILTGINDPGQRKQTDELLKALSPTFKAGELDAAFSIQGEHGPFYNIIAGIKVHQGAELARTMNRLLTDLHLQIPVAERPGTS